MAHPILLRVHRRGLTATRLGLRGEVEIGQHYVPGLVQQDV